MAPPKPNYT